MTTITALQLEEDPSRLGGCPVCVLAGDDDSLTARALRLVAQQVAPAEQAGSSVREFEDAPAPSDVFDTLRTIPFMGLEGRRLVVVRRGDEFLADHWELLLRYVRAPSETGTLVLCVSGLSAARPPGAGGGPEEGRARRWKQLVSALREQGVVVRCYRLRWSEAKAWVRSAAEKMGKNLTPRAVDCLVESVGPNLLALRGELEKLASYVGDERTVAERDVAEAVPAARSRSVFDLAEAVAGADAAGAFRLCRRLLLAGESKEAILNILAMDTRRLWQIKRLHGGGAGRKQIAGELSMPEFAVRRALRNLSGTTEGELARRLRLLAEADVEMKTTSLRAHEEEIWLENLLGRLCQRPQRAGGS